MANYIQYDGGNSQTNLAQRLLDNGSDWLSVRVGEFEYLFIQGSLDKESNKIVYDGRSWNYNSRTNTLSYNEDDSGQVTLVNDSYIYSSIEGYQGLSVRDVFPKYIFILLFALILVLVGFNVIKKRWIL